MFDSDNVKKMSALSLSIISFMSEQEAYKH